jgi:hypothetical protein
VGEGGWKALGSQGTVITLHEPKSMLQKGLENAGDVAKQALGGAVQLAGTLIPMPQLAQGVLLETGRKMQERGGLVGKAGEIIMNTPAMQQTQTQFTQAKHDREMHEVKVEGDLSAEKLNKKITLLNLKALEAKAKGEQVDDTYLKQLQDQRQRSGIDKFRLERLKRQEEEAAQKYAQHIKWVEDVKKEQERIADATQAELDRLYEQQKNEWLNNKINREKFITGLVDGLVQLAGYGVNAKAMLAHQLMNKTIADKAAEDDKRIEEENKKALEEHRKAQARHASNPRYPAPPPLLQTPTGLGSGIASAISWWVDKYPKQERKVLVSRIHITSPEEFLKEIQERDEQADQAYNADRKARGG